MKKNSLLFPLVLQFCIFLLSGRLLLSCASGPGGGNSGSTNGTSVALPGTGMASLTVELQTAANGNGKPGSSIIVTPGKVIGATITLDGPGGYTSAYNWSSGASISYTFQALTFGAYTIAVTNWDTSGVTDSCQTSFALMAGYNYTITIALGGEITISNVPNPVTSTNFIITNTCQNCTQMEYGVKGGTVTFGVDSEISTIQIENKSGAIVGRVSNAGGLPAVMQYNNADPGYKIVLESTYEVTQTNKTHRNIIHISKAKYSSSTNIIVSNILSNPLLFGSMTYSNNLKPGIPLYPAGIFSIHRD